MEEMAEARLPGATQPAPKEEKKRVAPKKNGEKAAPHGDKSYHPLSDYLTKNAPKSE